MTVAGLQLALKQQRDNPDERVTPPTVELDIEQRQLMGNLLPLLSSFERRVLVLASCFKQTPKAITELLGCTTEDIHTIIINAEKQLRPKRTSSLIKPVTAHPVTTRLTERAPAVSPTAPAPALPRAEPASGAHRQEIVADQRLILSSMPYQAIFWRNLGPEQTSLADEIVISGLQFARGKIIVSEKFGLATARRDKCGYIAVLGQTDAEIADALSMGINTVKSHLRRLFTQRGVKCRTQLAHSYLSDGSLQVIPENIFCKLTPTEEMIVEQLRMGLANKQIASNLYLSEHTVKTHLRRIFRRNNFTRREHVALAAMFAKAAERQPSL